jgi:predicted Rossmann fold nucleotide-binding protein DprA/Smf involved in DNA uptake
MRVIIAGSRSIVNAEVVANAVEASGYSVTEVISGGARGVDGLGEKWGLDRGIPVRRIEPDWKVFKRGAGPQRNREMANVADALVAIWDGKSRGTADMIRTARKFNLLVYVYSPAEEGEQG